MSYGGSPDLTFVAAGYVATPFPTGNTIGAFPQFNSKASVVQSDGKLIVVGALSSSSVGGPVTFGFEGFYARRYNADGSLDATFDANPHYNSPSLHSGAYAQATGVALQADGSVLVVGDDDNIARVVRLTPSGALDPTFGTGGIVTLGAAGTGGTSLDYAETVAVLPGGEIAVGGAVEPIAGTNSPAVEVLHADGSVVSTYGTNGVAVVPIPANAQAFPRLDPYAFNQVPVSTVIQPDGKIVIDVDANPSAMSPSTEISSTRLGVGGQLDPS